jgi:hypothetical protein
MLVQHGSGLEGLVAPLQVADQSTSQGTEAASRPDELWRLVTAPGTVRFDVPRSSAGRHRLAVQVRALPGGAGVVLTSAALGARRRFRGFARDAGVELLREYVAIPSLDPPTCYVEDSPSALRYFLTQLVTLPRGGAVKMAALAAIQNATRYFFPAGLIGSAAPARMALGRVRPSATTPVGDGAAPPANDSGSLLDMPGMQTLFIALSKDPNAKVSVLLIPRGRTQPTLAVKLPTTVAAEATIAAERAVLTDLHFRLPGPILVSIPRPRVLNEVRGRPSLVTTALPGSPMTTRYHAWRHLATPAAVRADFLAVQKWLARFQTASAAERAPIDMDGGATDTLHRRFAGEPRLDGVLARLDAVHGRLRASTTPRTAVHGDFWFGNLLLVGGEISGVIDWESGATRGEPVRDIVRFALSYSLYLDRHTRAGHRVAGHPGLQAGQWGAGIAWAFDGEGWFPDLVREFVRDGLKRLGADPDCWREAMLAGLAEVAATADHPDFARQHFELLDRLSEPSASRSRARAVSA